ncbi:MAG: tRNA threonylcarbamoyladenosine dehydratase [Ruminococcus sp.]|nr:tRNA threonylcarbamoyladenosine dehydratase [Ruminococcus sp.]
MENQFERTQRLLGTKAIEKLKNSRVAVFGVGGVGGYVVEVLARSGVGEIDIIDHDTVALSNLNRQIIALHSTLGQYKVDAAESRLLDINPEIKVRKHNCFFTPENADEFDFEKYDYVVDAVDTVAAKLELVERANKAGVRIISSMGAGNKLDPTRFEVSDIFKTEMDPLARVMRKELKARGIRRLKVVYSKEKPITPAADPREAGLRKKSPASAAFVPSVAGLIIAGEVVKDLIEE